MKKLFAILFIGVVVSCNNDDPKATTDLVTISIEKGATTFSESWYVVWDDDGTLLDYKKYNEGEELTMTTTEEITNNKISIGHFGFLTDGGHDVHQIIIVTDLTPGVSIKRAKHVDPKSTGSFKVIVKNEPSDNFAIISCKYGINGYGEGPSGDSKPSTGKIIEGANKYIITYDGVPGVYGEINNVKDQDEITLDFNDFKSFENTVSIKMPESYDYAFVYLDGVEPSQPLTDFGYRLSSAFIQSTTSTEFKAGYFSPLSKFNTAISIASGDASIGYYKSGSLPGAIKWPDPGKYSIESKDPNALSVSVSEPVEYIVASWANTDAANVTLNIMSPKLAPKIGAVPPEMITAHPLFEIKKSLYSNSSVSFIVKGSQPYLDNVNDLFTDTFGEEQTTTVGFNSH